jgi:hypothetical protein
MTNKYIAISSVVAASALLFAAGKLLAPEPTKPEVRAPRAEAPAEAARDKSVDAVSRHVRTLEGHIGRLEKQIEALPEPAPTAKLDDELPPPEQAPSQVQERPNVDPTVIRDEFEAYFYAEDRDDQGSVKELDDIRQYFSATTEQGIELQNAECRSTLCRVSLKLRDDDARQTLLASLGRPPFGQGGFFHKNAETGDFTIIAARSGHQLPTLDVTGGAAAQE